MVRANGQRLVELCNGLVGIATVPVGGSQIGANIGVLGVDREGFAVVLDGLRVSLAVVV